MGRDGDGGGRGGGRGGGAEALARSKQYAYHEMSTKVITADTRSRDPKEPDGTAASLLGKIDPKSFGNRVQYEKPGGDEAKRRAGGRWSGAGALGGGRPLLRPCAALRHGSAGARRRASPATRRRSGRARRARLRAAPPPRR